MSINSFDRKVEDFLSKKKPSTRKIYTAGLLAFQEFYAPYGDIPDFLDQLQADRSLDWRQRKNVAANVISEYVNWLKRRFKRKTVRTYVGAIQQLAKYYNLEFSTRDTQLPASNPELKKHPWTLEEVQHFLDLFDHQMYRSFAVLIFQSFFDCRTALELEYRDIQGEYETRKVPLCLDTERFKTEIPFCSFIGRWGVFELKKWLTIRGKLNLEDKLFPVSEQAVAEYFRRKTQLFLDRPLARGERSPCGTHSLRAGGMTLAQDNLTGDPDQVRAAERYIDFFAGKTVPEQRRVYISKSREGWRQTWQTRIEPYVTPKDFNVK